MTGRILEIVGLSAVLFVGTGIICWPSHCYDPVYPAHAVLQIEQQTIDRIDPETVEIFFDTIEELSAFILEDPQERLEVSLSRKDPNGHPDGREKWDLVAVMDWHPDVVRTAWVVLGHIGNCIGEREVRITFRDVGLVPGAAQSEFRFSATEWYWGYQPEPLIVHEFEYVH
jgi:hypothetical protein